MEESSGQPQPKGLLDQELFPEASRATTPQGQAGGKPPGAIKDSGDPNAFDDPMPLLFEQKKLDLIYVLSHLISCNLLVFMRRRVGERNLRLWVLFLNAGLLTACVDLSGGIPNPFRLFSPPAETPPPIEGSPYQTFPYGNASPGAPYGVPYAGRPYNPNQSPYGTAPQPPQIQPQTPSNDGGFGKELATLYVLAMLAVGWYQNGMSKEWGEMEPGLLTGSRGQSRLGDFLNRHVIPKEAHGLGFAWSFTQEDFYQSPWFPLGERFIHQRLEPLLAGVTGGLLFFSSLSPVLGLWLMFSSLCLSIAEYRYYERGRTMYLDRRDAKLEALALGSLDELQASETDQMEALPVAVSETLLAHRKRNRLLAAFQAEREETENDESAQELPDHTHESRNGKGGLHP